MKHVSNEEKANEIANAFFIENVSAENEQLIREMLNKASFDAMQWKDKERKELWRITRNHYQEWAEEQIAKEKQQLIDKLEDWLANNICTAHNFRGDNISATFMNDCIEAMKGK